MRRSRTIAIVCAVAAFAAAGFFAFAPSRATAHEQYVLTKGQFASDYAATGLNVWSSLASPHNRAVALAVGLGSLAVAIVYFIFTRSRWAPAVDRTLKHYEPLGVVAIRVAIGFSFVYSALTHVYLGPEIPEASLPFGVPIHVALYIVGVLLILGLFSEFAGLVSLVILGCATWVYGAYMLTYFNYFGEFLALFLLGSRVFSVDRLIFGVKRAGERWKEWETLLLRVTYGISILYPAITIKLFHPEVIVDIVNRYNLNTIHWLFPGDPLLISLGAGLAQIAVGILIIIGFETRLASLVTFVLYVLSISFFREVVWPHYILLALSFYFVLNDGGALTVDRWMEKHFSRSAERPVHATGAM